MSVSVNLTLPDGSVRSVAVGTTAGDVARDIGAGLAKAALAARVNQKIVDLEMPIETDAQLEIITAKDEAAALELVRHDYAHILAEAVQNLFPGTQITFGPATDDGFYYDFAPVERPFTDEDLPAIEEEMRRIVRADKPLRREVWERDALIARWREQGETFKAEWAAELPDDEPLSVYWSGDGWFDMCRGPHLTSTGKLDPQAFKLMRVSGAYWRGDQRNPQLSRIYGTGWLTKKQLDQHLVRLEEAAKRDHRKLGQQMDLFHFQEEAAGSIFWHANGWTLYQALEQYMRRRQNEAGYSEVRTPQVFRNDFWVTSGHWGKFRENMFVIPDERPSTEDEGPLISPDPVFLALKPMNCPAHIQIFDHGIKSWRDLPVRMAEFGCCHRNEPHGALHGLMRVRQFVQDDAHIFCREDQVLDESRAFIALLQRVYADLGFDDWFVRLATRPESRAGSDEVWDKAEQGLEQALNDSGLAFEWAPGEGAFYGPKIEFHLKDAIGRSWQCGTLQLDFVLPERFDIHYIGEDGGKHRPVMLHRAIVGSMERFLAILIENYAGNLPLWLAPCQVVVATIVSDADDYAQQLTDRLKAAGLRVETDLRNEKINYKVREHSVAKVPVLLVVGRREAEEGTVAMRRLGQERQQFLPIDEAIAALASEAVPPDLRGKS
ncbi:MAG: threonine--tRNA ligase [Sphingomonadaceae bacterium]